MSNLFAIFNNVASYRVFLHFDSANCQLHHFYLVVFLIDTIVPKVTYLTTITASTAETSPINHVR